MAKQLKGKKISAKKEPLKKSIPFSTIIVWLFFFFVAIMYVLHITRDVYSGDVGDLVTAANVFGVPHPPGYPLFTLLGFIFSKLPLFIPPVSKVALVSSIASLIGLIYFYKLSFKLTKNIVISLLSTSILAFSYLFWLHAELPEVFGLNNCFVLVMFYYAVVFNLEKRTRDLYILAFVSVLAFTHHQTIIFIYPAIMILVLRHIQMIITSKRIIITTLLCGCAAWLIYLYVPIAASLNPVVNWDHATTIKSLIQLILRKDYGTAPGISNGVPVVIKMIVIKNFFESVITTYSYQIVFVMLLGVIYLLKKNKWLLASISIAFIVSGPLFLFYGTPIITTVAYWGVVERFYIMPKVILAFFIPFGFLFIKEILNKVFSKNIYSYVLLAYFLIIPLFEIQYNLPKVDLSKTHIGNDLARNILINLPKNSVLFLSGDTTTFNTWYVRYVLGVRKDVDIINQSGVGGNTYLEDELNNYHMKHPEIPVNRLLGYVINDIRKRRPVFSNAEMNQIPIPADSILLPRGLVYELVKRTDIPSSEDAYITQFEQQWREVRLQRRETLSSADQNLIAAEIPTIYSSGLVRIGNFIDEYYKDSARAESYYRRALWIDDENPSAYSGLGLMQFKAYKDCTDAISNMKEAISLYPMWQKYYQQLSILYDKCGVDSKTKNAFNSEYKRLFNENINGSKK